MNDMEQNFPEKERKTKNTPAWLKKTGQGLKRFFTGKVFRTIMHVLGRILCVVLVTALLLVIGLYGVMYVLAKGPSPQAQVEFVRSVRETSAIGFLANLFYTDEQIAQMLGTNDTGKTEDVQEMDKSLIKIDPPVDQGGENQGDQKPVPDAWGLVDEDGDGIIVQEVRGEGYQGYMMVVKDPSRVIAATVPSSFGKRGYTVAEMVEHYDAVAAVNAGGFYDPAGQGDGSIPDSVVVFDGEMYYASSGIRNGFAGFDSGNILHVGNFTPQQIKDRDIQYGVCFGPVLIVNGEPVDSDNLASGVNPRTAIGQRSDGAVLLLVIDGRQVSSLGASYQDLVEIFLSYGAVNACNLDGGSSSMMWYQGGYINSATPVVGVRRIPSAIIVLKEGVDMYD